nr:odorant binding protein 39 [Pagiophloeus tsushimanus]
MGKSAIFLCGICIYFLGVVQLTPVPYQHLSKEELHHIALECIEEVNIDRAVIEKVLKTQILPKENKKYKRYLECSYKKQGFLSPDGTQMLYNNLFQFLQRFYDRSELHALDQCKLIKAEDGGELCFQNLDCILNGLRTIENQKAIISNDIS